MNCSDTIFTPAEILLPQGVDMKKWSVIACDQYTSDSEYWRRVAELVGSAPSTYHITLPEAYLESPDVEARIADINRRMESYLSDGVFGQPVTGYIYIERQMLDGSIRQGLLGALDLEAYDFDKGSCSAVRCTEGTILSRIPPRLKVRENAPIETPHVMMLIDDPHKSVVELAAANKEAMQVLYDFDLMENGGRITGRLVEKSLCEEITSALMALTKENELSDKYGDCCMNAFLIAAGDGNHSLATAKVHYENLKKTLTPAEAAIHPARYALVELINLHSPALVFEPIHRVLFETNPDKLISALRDYYITGDTAPGQHIVLTYGDNETEIYIKNPSGNLAVGSLQQFLDDFVAKNGGKIDYIHEASAVRELSSEPDTVGFILPNMDKSELFKTVILDGALPRKTFSMGHSDEKRFYLECRKIRSTL